MIEKLIAWYADNCDGDWEHQNGFIIRTLDNPGLSIVIDLVEFEYGEPETNQVLLSIGDPDTDKSWLQIKYRNGKLVALSSVDKFSEALEYVISELN